MGLVLGLPLSILFLWLALRNVDFTAVRTALRHADAMPVALAVCALAAVYAVQAFRWRSIAAAPQVSIARFCEMVVSGIACNNVLPARLGDLFRARWLSRVAPMPAGRAFGTVVVDRAFDLAALLFILVIGLAALASSLWLVRLAIGAAAALAAVAAVIAFARIYTGRRERGRRSRGVLRGLVRDTAEALAEPFGKRRPFVWLAISLAAWTAWSVGAILVARALDFHLGLVDALFVAAVMNLGVAIPSSPGFVGTYEWLGVSTLGLLGVPSEPALAFAILLHACWYFPTTFGGGIALVSRGIAGLRRTHGTDAINQDGSGRGHQGLAVRRAP